MDNKSANQSFPLVCHIGRCLTIFFLCSAPLMAKGQDVGLQTYAQSEEIILKDDKTTILNRCREWHISTNILEWALAISNVRGEFDFAGHWSAGLSLHYSGWNYGKSTRKFRTFIFRPEARYWCVDKYEGLFMDCHFQMAAYNFALPGWKYRIQDVDGKNPALGGGLGIGYRLPVSHDGRWSAEGIIGAGVYHLQYNRYDNTANGQLFDCKKRTWFGIDNVSLSIVYNFKAR